jgi:SPP1 gp7 family putative phage head morphogenesis protein
MGKPSVSIGRTPFTRAIEYFKAKTPRESQAYTDLLHEEHDRSFVIAGCTKVAVVTDVQALLEKAMQEGVPFEQWRKEFEKTINGRWLPTSKTGEDNTGWRARVIYETNMKTAYAAGRYGQLQRMKKLFPFWRYRIGNSRKHRPEHEAWNGLVLRADDPWWDTHYPPNGWGCNCYVQPLDEVDLRELGKEGPDPAPEGGSRRVQYGNRVIDVPDGIDAGWAYAPGKSGMQAQMNALAKAEPEVAAMEWERIREAAVRQDAPEYKKWVKEKYKDVVEKAEEVEQAPQAQAITDYKQWVTSTLVSPTADTRIADEARTIGFFDRPTMKLLGTKNATLEMANIDPIHIMKDKRARITIEDLLALQENFADPTKIRAILRDKKHTEPPAYLFVFDAVGQTIKGGQTHRAKFVVKVDMETRFSDGTVRKATRIISAGLVPEHNLADKNMLERLLWLL